MNKKIVIAGIAGGTLLFLLGWLIYGILLMDYMDQHAGLKPASDRGEGDMQLNYILAGSILQGIMLAYVLVRANVTTVADGFITGAIISLLFTSSIDFTIYGTTYLLSKHSILADVIAATAIGAVTGAIMVLIINVVSKKG